MSICFLDWKMTRWYKMQPASIDQLQTRDQLWAGGASTGIGARPRSASHFARSSGYAVEASGWSFGLTFQMLQDHIEADGTWSRASDGNFMQFWLVTICDMCILDTWLVEEELNVCTSQLLPSSGNSPVHLQQDTERKLKGLMGWHHKLPSVAFAPMTFTPSSRPCMDEGVYQSPCFLNCLRHWIDRNWQQFDLARCQRGDAFSHHGSLEASGWFSAPEAPVICRQIDVFVFAMVRLCNSTWLLSI